MGKLDSASGQKRPFKVHTGAVVQILHNEPVLFMKDGEILECALEESRVVKDDLIAKLREANVHRMSDVRAAVLETTGGVSVLHGDGLADELLAGVNRATSAQAARAR